MAKRISKTEKRIQALEETIFLDRFWETYAMAFKRCRTAKYQKVDVKVELFKSLINYPQHHESEYRRSVNGYNLPFSSLDAGEKSRVRRIIPSHTLPKNEREQRRKEQQITRVIKKTVTRNRHRMEFSEGRDMIPEQFIPVVSSIKS